MTRLSRTTAAALAALALLLSLGACSSDDGDDDDAIVQMMVDEGAPREQAECMVDRLGSDDAERFFEASDEDLSEEELERLYDALAECVPDTDLGGAGE